MRVGRYAKAVAREGRADELAGVLLGVAALLEDVPGCELYVINRSASEPDAVWVTEIWRSQDDLDAALRLDAVRELIPQVLDLVTGGMERTDVLPVGGKGLA